MFTAEELKNLSREAADKITVPNLIRKKLKLPPLKRGATKGNQRAKGNPGRWKKEKE